MFCCARPKTLEGGPELAYPAADAVTKIAGQWFWDGGAACVPAPACRAPTRSTPAGGAAVAAAGARARWAQELCVLLLLLHASLWAHRSCRSEQSKRAGTLLHALLYSLSTSTGASGIPAECPATLLAQSAAAAVVEHAHTGHAAAQSTPAAPPLAHGTGFATFTTTSSKCRQDSWVAHAVVACRAGRQQQHRCAAPTAAGLALAEEEPRSEGAAEHEQAHSTAAVREPTADLCTFISFDPAPLSPAMETGFKRGERMHLALAGVTGNQWQFEMHAVPFHPFNSPVMLQKCH